MNTFSEIALNWFLVWEPEYKKHGNIQTIRNFLMTLNVQCEDANVRHFALNLLLDGTYCADKSVFDRQQLLFFKRLFRHAYSHAYGYDCWFMPDVCEECIKETIGPVESFDDDIAF